MPNKKPRRTFDRILDVTLALFNRFGEPNVSTSQLCGELGISPGNLFYHHPTRDALVHGLFSRYQAALSLALGEVPGSETPAEPAAIWPEASPALQALTGLCEHIARTAWTYRFLFRDLSDLVSRHRLLEEQLPPLLRQQAERLQHALDQQRWQSVPDDMSIKLWVGPILATLTGSMGLDGAMDPRERLRESEDQVCERAVMRALGLIGHALQAVDSRAIALRISQTEQLGQDPWWLISPQG